MAKSIHWKKLGLVLTPKSLKLDWVRTHCWVPTIDDLGGGLVRILFAGRDANNLSQVGAAILHLEEPHRILDISREPLLRLGPLGAFDDSAVLPSYVLPYKEGGKLLYYVAWMQGKRVPFYATIGVAESRDGGATYEKCSRAPLLDRNDIDPFFMAANCVHIEQGRWRMWYTTNTAWRCTATGPLPRYHIKYAESSDGKVWERKGIVAIDFHDESEYAISRPWVMRDGDQWRMWFSYRGEAYRIGYAESADGVRWERMDKKAGISVSTEGFDSEMIEYASVIVHDGRHFMFYNGNNYGFDGIGLAVEE